MFEKLTKKVAEKMGHSVKTTIEPIKMEVQKTVDSKVDLYSRILRLAVLVFLFIDGTKRISNTTNDPANSPNQIIINNYISRKDGED